ncbi:uncharacterized protein BKCO1_5400068 [Diplodia corticola]|uniref:Uncharacterized protein n=1 Tax=Diplodia corticola TaxID=236234 RepID=A0A1J9QR08_9PEZI|nr:uncharacterized protein BKCO1_5400068 [Diplodia corticola]OJD30880.1 hypothetical protein BKCO1_5400068 [Diplodia corticola]
MVSRPVSPVSPASPTWSRPGSTSNEHTDQPEEATPRTPAYGVSTPHAQVQRPETPQRPSHDASAGQTYPGAAASVLSRPREDERLKLWTPFFLRRPALLSFIALFVILIVVLAILFGLSSRDERLTSADSRLYYLWVYGPTAVFTSIAAFWAQVEYRSKQMTPWVLMAQEPQPVRKSLLLDYIDTMNVVGLISSLRNRHWLVHSALAGTFLIQAITVLSSGLFISTQTTIRAEDADLTAWSVFSGSIPATAGSEPAANAYAVLASNLSYPNGTHDRYAFQWFNSPKNDVFNMTASVDVFSADLSCEIANVTDLRIGQSYGNNTNTLDEALPLSTGLEHSQAEITMDASSCQNLYISVKDGVSFGYNGSFCSNLNPQEEDTGRFVLVWGEWKDAASTPERRSPQDISLDDSWTTLRDATTREEASTGVSIQTIGGAGSTRPTSTTGSTITAETSSHTTRQTSDPSVISIDDGDLGISSTRQSLATTTSSSGIEPTPGVPFTLGSLTLQVAAPTFSPSLGLVCAPSYSIRKGSVALNKDNNGEITPSISFYGNETAATLSNVTSWDILKAFAQTVAQTERSISTLNMEALINATIPQASLTTDANTTQAALIRLFRLTSAQFANIYLTNSTEAPLTGVAVSREARLQLHALSFWLIEALLLILILATSFLFFKSPTIATPRDPSTIAGLATILARSTAVVSDLKGSGLESTKDIDQRLQTHRFSTSATVSAHSSHPHFRIESAESEHRASTTTDQAEAEQSKDVTWYRPFVATVLGRGLVLSAPLALILTLELLYQYSSQNNGLLAVDDANLFVHYAWTYVPTAVMVAVGQTFAMLDTTAKLFNPYHNLRKGNASAEKSIMENYMRSVTVAALCRAARKLQYTVVAAGMAAVLTPFLTIVVSGLFNAESAPTAYTASFARLDNFDPNTTTTGNGLAYANLVLANNLSEPLWTHQDLAFPQLSQSASSITDDSGSAVSVAAVNASSVSLALPAVRGNLNCTPATHAEIYCDELAPYLLSQPNSSYGDPRQNQYFSGTGYFGDVFALDARVYPGCPAVMVAFGHVDNKTIDSVTHLSCSPYVETVNATASFKLPSWELDTSSPVTTDENETSVFYDGQMPDFLTDSGYSFANPLPVNRSDEDFASIFPLAIYGRNGTPVAELFGPDNIGNLQRAVESTYALVMAQVLNWDRQQLGGDDVTSAGAVAFEGNLTDRTSIRLVQSAVSTRILEGLLAAMFVCAALTFALLDTKKVLPKNPCSVAAMASLLAGSKLLAAIPEGAEWMSDRQLRQKGVFEGMVFSMGWWGDGSGVSDDDGRSSSGGDGQAGRSRFGIDIGTAEKGKVPGAKRRWWPARWKRRESQGE